jgi:hypothetical protein
VRKCLEAASVSPQNALDESLSLAEASTRDYIVSHQAVESQLSNSRNETPFFVDIAAPAHLMSSKLPSSTSGVFERAGSMCEIAHWMPASASTPQHRSGSLISKLRDETSYGHETSFEYRLIEE